jgi:hypothetical protein
MSFASNLRELATGILRFGFNLAQVKGESATALSARNSTDAGYANMRGLAPIIGADFVTLKFFEDRRIKSAAVWVANYDLRYFSVGAGVPAPASDGGDGLFDGQRYLTEAVTLTAFRVVQRSPGDGGTTTVELLRNRAGTWTVQAAVSLAALTNLETGSAVPADTAALAGDQYAVRFAALQTGSGLVVPLDLSAQLEL